MKAVFRIDRPTMQAFFALILGRFVMWSIWRNVPDKLGSGLLLALVAIDLTILAAQLWLIHRARRVAGTGVVSFTLGLLALIATALTLAVDLDRTALAYLKPPPTLPAQPLLKTIETRVVLTGDIGFDSYNALRATLIADPNLTTLQLDSSGGRIPAARGIARLVREANLATHVSGTCASACTIVLAAGHVRSMEQGSRIGFHSYRLISTVATLSPSDEQERDKSELAAQGISVEFLDRAFATPHDQMWFPSTEELRAAGVLTD
ncbi:hypothetical protein N9M66_03820 [Litoreibacter sp.]|nr:hypothetical protein [Litoreibacter sp.]